MEFIDISTDKKVIKYVIDWSRLTDTLKNKITQEVSSKENQKAKDLAFEIKAAGILQSVDSGKNLVFWTNYNYELLIKKFAEIIKYKEKSEGYECYLISIYIQGDKMLKYIQNPLPEQECEEQTEKIETTEFNGSIEWKFNSKRNQSAELVESFKKTHEQTKD